ncbi:MAG: GntR family transcriptional regulator [Acidobacteria bacterium]|nr:GntR family transcriptional regulator [Acidobacteriota bacterium]
MALTDFSPVRNLSKSAEVFKKLRNAIWSGELLPGTALREAHIAKQLSVSQVPVREALLQLEHLGLVVRVPDRGTHVTRLTRAEMVQLMEVRSHLEDLAFRLAARRMTPAVEAHLRDGLNQLEQCIRASDHLGVAEADLRFHEIVWKASGNTVLEKTLDRLCVSVYAFVGLARRAAGEKLATVSHEILFDALLKGDPKVISKAIRDHLNPALSIPASVGD